ncbi:alpha/beta hydrolase family protein [Bradyrhizobium sp.]|uniref:alpha/beta hydrolase family protein n=1 Tax=Bradyrhizobium sp. TaxID=376 RepID=UPI004037D209
MKIAWSVLGPVVAAVLCTAAAAQDGKPAGTASIAVNAGAPRAFTGEFWFEAAPGERVEGFAPRPPLRAIPIARNARPAPDRGRRPLIVISHGNWGGRYSQGWLAIRLVHAGFVVLSTSHPGTLGDDQTVAGRLRLWDRSRDVSSALGELLGHSSWSALIDADRIGFVGHSFGGWTGVSLAGGRYDPQIQRESCMRMARPDPYCESTLKDDINGVAVSDARDSFRDSRFKAYYIMASGPGQGFSAESLASIDVPFVVDTAKGDEILEPEANSSRLARLIPGAREIIRPVGHFAYVPECKWLIGSMLARIAGAPICDDPGGVDRAAVHEQIAADVIAFFNARLSSKRGGAERE